MKKKDEQFSPIYEIDDEVWDRYVSEHPNGHHEQTSMFAAIRSDNNYRSLRVGLINSNGALCAGAQLLYRKIPIIGKIAFIFQGPLVTGGSTECAQLLIEALDQLAVRYRIKCLRIVNYTDYEFWKPILERTGFLQSGKAWAPDGTVLVYCNQSDETIMAGMHKKCRYGIRYAIRNEVKAKVYQEDGLPIFYELLSMTAQRKGYNPLPFTYYQYIWKLFSASNKIFIIVSSKDDEPLSSVMMTIVGETAYYGWGGMSLSQSKLQANYLTHWEAIRLARTHGCTHYDLSGGEQGSGGVSKFKRKWSNITNPYPDPIDKYYGFAKDLRSKMTNFCWENEGVRKVVNKINYRLRGGSMPF